MHPEKKKREKEKEYGTEHTVIEGTKKNAPKKKKEKRERGHSSSLTEVDRA